MLRRNVIFFCLVLIGSTSSAQIFTEKSAEIGIIHQFESRGLMGGGCAFFDFDRDGDDDLYLTGGGSVDALYRNDSGTFVLHENFNLTAQYYTTGISVGDLDNDGFRDFVVTTWVAGNEEISRNLLYRNNGDNTFTELGETAGLVERAFSIGANMFDFNQDGLLDIYVINHVASPAFLYDMNGAIIGFDHECYPNHLYLNNGDFTFTEIGESLNAAGAACTLASIPTDYDEDGDLDIFIANDFGPFIVPNEVYQNNFPDLFLSVADDAGMGQGIYGMGIANGDYDNDLDLDYYVTNLGQNLLLENDNGSFTDQTLAAGVSNEWANESEFSTGWGTAFFDINNDSWEDLMVVNGRIPSLSTLPTAMQDPDKLYLNNGDKTFTDISEAEGVDDLAYGRGMAYSDFDLDGDLDMMVMNLDELGATCKFYENQGNTNNYLQLDLEGTISNRDALGSKVYVYTPQHTYLKESFGGGASHCSQHSNTLHFGLRAEMIVDSVIIHWPSGIIQKFDEITVNNRIHLIEKDPTVPVHNISSDSKFKIYPNPVTSDLKIQIPEELIGELLNIRLIDIMGNVYMEKSISAQHMNIVANSSDLVPGIYLMELSTSGIIRSRHKLWYR